MFKSPFYHSTKVNEDRPLSSAKAQFKSIIKLSVLCTYAVPHSSLICVPSMCIYIHDKYSENISTHSKWFVDVKRVMRLLCPAAQSVCVQRVCAGEEPARVSAGPPVRALPLRVPLQDPAVWKLPLSWGNHQVGVNIFTALVLWRDAVKHTKHLCRRHNYKQFGVSGDTKALFSQLLNIFQPVV